MRQLLLVLVLGQQAFGQASIGERVVTRHGTILKVGNAVVDDENRGHDLAVAGKDRRVFRVYQVQQVESPWVWLVSENDGVQGWTKVENDQVRPGDRRPHGPAQGEAQPRPVQRSRKHLEIQEDV